MIRLGLRLTFGGGKEAAVRLAVTVAAVGLGVGLLLIALSGINAINAQNARTAWLNTGAFRGHGQLGLPGAVGGSAGSGAAPFSTHASTSGPAPGVRRPRRAEPRSGIG